MTYVDTFAAPAGLHVVLGAGPLGRAVAAALADTGRRVRMVNRSGRLAGLPSGVESVRADLRASDALASVVEGAAAIYFCAQPAYHRWPQEFPALQEAAVALALKAGARLVVAENLYGYGPSEAPLHEDAPLVATTRKGRVRAQMHAALLQARDRRGLRVAVARGSDFYGPHVEGSVVGSRAFRALERGGAVECFGDPDAVHAFTFVEDFGRALAVLGTDPRAEGQAWHVPNAPAVSQRRFFEIAARLGERRLKLRTIGVAEMRVLGLFIPPLREMIEMRYEFEKPFLVDHGKFARTFGDLSTPLEVGLRKTLDWIRVSER